MELELVFNWVIKSSMMASILAVLILLVKYALGNKLDAKWQYAIWMLLIIRLLIPYDIQSPWSIYSLIPNNSVISPIVDQIRIPDSNAQIGNISGKEIQLTNDQSTINKQSSTKQEEPIAKDLSIGSILAMIWLVGAFILAVLTIATNLRFYLRVRREPSVIDVRMSKLMQECTSKTGIRRNLPIIITNRIDSPCLYGIVSPKLLLPQPLVNRLNDENIRHIFFHELSHFRRKDILINWLAVAVQIVHWFNPLIWYSFARMREDCELACDADTLCSLLPEEYQSYGLSIISLVTPAQSSWLPGTTGFFGNENNQQIRRRIKMIKFFKKPTSKWTWTAVVIFISLGLIGFTNSTSNASPETGALVKSNLIPLATMPNTKIENNSLSRGTWKISVTKVEFKARAGQEQKMAQVYTPIEATAGKNTPLLPTGSFTGIIGSSGKIYNIPVKDASAHMDRSLGVYFAQTETSRKDDAVKRGVAFEQGVFLLAQDVVVDNAEQSITAVIYQDEKGNVFNIPVTVKPTTEQITTIGK